MPDAIIEELWRVKDRMAREAGYDVAALAAALRGAPDQKRANRGGSSGMREAQDPATAEGVGSDSHGLDVAPTV